MACTEVLAQKILLLLLLHLLLLQKLQLWFLEKRG